ncbi:uncharacterized protein PRCAT00000990001 [Priceomyces carsonii]|uniref:uncharacterized protein n=1 Tax=Priceomyces carsonii TaxID=28549 RepID=UPI002EDB5189|nr:unnamed protein product [Priceomyces carsonii]
MVLFQTINRLANPHSAAGLPAGRRRRFFIPPSTRYPLFLYGQGEDQRSFLSLIERGSAIENEESDSASVSTSRSLPSTLNSAHTNDTQESFNNWLIEEHQRRKTGQESEDSDGSPNNEHLYDHESSLISARSFSSSESEDFENMKTSTAFELRKLSRYSLPLIITFLLEHLFSMVCLMVVGHLGKSELAAVSLGSMSSTITFAIFEGTATALDTLCPQAYGAGNYELVSKLVQRCILISWIGFIPCGFLWWYSPLFLKFIISDAEVLDLTALFLRILIIGAPAYIFFENAKRFLQAQGIFEAGTGVLALSAPINIFLSWLLVWNKSYGLGYIGAPIATVINFWLMSILLVLYVVWVDGRKCWFGVESFRELFSQWGGLLHLAIPGIVMLESEYLAYEIMTLMASYFGTIELAAQSAVSSIASFTYMVPFALSIASSTRIANFIGAQNLVSAEIATHSGMIASIFVSILNCIILFTFKDQIASLFTQDEDVKSLIVDLFNPLVAVIQIFDGIASVASGILRAQGSQKIGGIINFLAYYAFAMPLALFLSKYTELKLYGLWIGIGSGMILIGLSESIIILRTNWDDILIRAGLLLKDDDEVIIDERVLLLS